MWQIRLLGAFSAESAERTIERTGFQNVAQLLAYLAYYERNAHPRDSLQEILRPEGEWETARTYFRKVLSALRGELEPLGTPRESVLITDRQTVRLNRSAFATDVRQFRTALQHARGGAQHERSVSLEKALALYGGEFLPQFAEEWVVRERAILAEEHRQARFQLITLREAEGDWGGALVWARRAVADEPLVEESHGVLIHLLRITGKPKEAHRQYEVACEIFQRQLGQSPTPRLEALLTEPLQPIEPVRPPTARPRPPRSGPPLGTPATPPPPSGLVTFLFFEVGRECPKTPEPQPSPNTEPGNLLAPLVTKHGGTLLDEAATTESGTTTHTAAFVTASAALRCALSTRQSLGARLLRMAFHVAEAQWNEGGYQSSGLADGPMLLRAAPEGQILCSAAAAGVLGPALEARGAHTTAGQGHQLVDLGIYYLRRPPVGNSQRLFALRTPDMPPTPLPPPRAEAVYEGNRPTPITEFFGRERELDEIGMLLKEHRLVTLTGPGGTGKSRLALELAARLETDYHGAVWWTALQALTDAERIPDTLVTALRLPRTPGMEPFREVQRFLTRQRSLLVLDNLEHLLPRGAVLLQSLLEETPSLTVLATSRVVLGITGERSAPVSPLPVPEPEAGRWEAAGPGLETLMQCASVQLFMNRAHRVRPHFALNRENAAAVCAVCRILEGLPLALELAAARMATLSLPQLIEGLKQRFEILKVRHASDPRHKSLRAALDGSYEALTPELQQIFRHLTVFRGGWTAAAAAHVCGVANIDDAMEALQQTSLIQAEVEGEEPRFQRLETLREYGAEKLREADEEETARTRHSRWYFKQALRARDPLTGPDQKAWIEALEREHDNLRAALDWAKESGKIGQALRFAAALWEFWSKRGHTVEGRARLLELLSLPEARHPTFARAQALQAAARAAADQDLCGEGRPLLEEQLAIACRLHPGKWSSRETKTSALLYLASAMGEYRHAHEPVESYLEDGIREARALVKHSVHPIQIRHAQTLLAFGAVVRAGLASVKGQFSEARGHLEEALTIRRRLGERAGIARALIGLGALAWTRGEFAPARTLLEESLTIRRELGDRMGLISSLGHLALLARDQGDDAAARAFLIEALKWARTLGQKGDSQLNSLGWVELLAGNPGAARERFQEACVAAPGEAVAPERASRLRGQAEIALEEGQVVEARALGGQALGIYRQLQMPYGIALSLLSLAWTALREKNVPQARAFLKESLPILGDNQAQPEIAAGSECLAAVSVGAGRPEQAVFLLAAADGLRQRIGAPLPLLYEARVETARQKAQTMLGQTTFEAMWERDQKEPLAELWEQALGIPLPEPE